MTEQVTPIQPVELPTPHIVTAEIMRLIRELDVAHKVSLHAARELAEAKYDHTITYAQARAAMRESAPEGWLADDRTSETKKIAAQSRKRLLLAEELRKSARDAEENIRTQLTAAQTVANTVRDEMRMAGRGTA